MRLSKTGKKSKLNYRCIETILQLRHASTKQNVYHRCLQNQLQHNVLVLWVSVTKAI